MADALPIRHDFDYPAAPGDHWPPIAGGSLAEGSPVVGAADLAMKLLADNDSASGTTCSSTVELSKGLWLVMCHGIGTTTNITWEGECTLTQESTTIMQQFANTHPATGVNQDVSSTVTLVRVLNVTSSTTDTVSFSFFSGDPGGNASIQTFIQALKLD